MFCNKEKLYKESFDTLNSQNLNLLPFPLLKLFCMPYNKMTHTYMESLLNKCDPESHIEQK